jgi:hypothetical protein
MARDFLLANTGVEVVAANDTLLTFLTRWRAAGGSGPSPLRAWAEACLPSVQSLLNDFRPDLILSEIFTMELARLTKAATGIRWCCVNPAYYFGADSRRPFESDFAGPGRVFFPQFIQGIGDADLVLHATDMEFDPPPASLPRNHHYVGPMWWEPSRDTPQYIVDPGDPWVLVSVSQAPQEGELTFARAALQSLATHPVRVVLPLTDKHPRSELGPIPANARVEGFVPHSEVLKRSCLLVSHAGHGVVAKALYYGVPMVLVPWDRDQPGVAARAAALGVGEAISRRDFNEQRLASAIRNVLGTSTYRENARRIAKRLQTQDAVALARAHIDGLH